jgi:hypothetical protein
VRVSRGSAALRELLAGRLFDVRELDQRQFAGWLERHLAHWRSDPVFTQRSRIRDLRRAHPELREAEAEQRRARTEDEASPLHARLEAVQRELVGADKAVAGLTHALGKAGAAERDALRAKREGFVGRVRELQRSKGRSSGRSGASFEQAALEAVRREVLAELDESADGGSLVVLHGVTLGAARTEIDSW